MCILSIGGLRWKAHSPSHFELTNEPLHLIRDEQGWYIKGSSYAELVYMPVQARDEGAKMLREAMALAIY